MVPEEVMGPETDNQEGTAIATDVTPVEGVIQERVVPLEDNTCPFVPTVPNPVPPDEGVMGVVVVREVAVAAPRVGVVRTGDWDKTTDPVPVEDPEIVMVPEEVMGPETESQDGTAIATDVTPVAEGVVH
jgi:hypothetical protein